MATERRKPRPLVLLEGPARTGRRGRSWGSGSPGGGGAGRLHLGPTGGCFSLTGRRRTAVQQRRAVGLWGRRRRTTQGWTDNPRLDGCGAGARRDLARLAPGSSLSVAEVMECICHPCERQKTDYGQFNPTNISSV